MLLSCVHLSVTRRYSTRTARITQTTPYGSTETLVFWCQKPRRNSNGVTPNGGAKYRWGRFERRFSTTISLHLKSQWKFNGPFQHKYISEMVQDRDIVTMEC